MLALSAALLLLSSSPAKKEAKPGDAELLVSPRMCLAGPVHPCFIYVHASIPKPVPEFYCPSVELRIVPDEPTLMLGDLTAYHEFQESDCEPWNEYGSWSRDKDGNIVDKPATGGVPWVWEFSSLRKRFGLPSGAWRIEVTLAQGTRRVRLEGRVSVKGEANERIDSGS